MTVIRLPVASARLILRPFTPADLEAVARYQSLPEVQRYLDWKARDKVDCKAALAVMCTQRRLTRPGDTLSLAVARRADGTLLGQIGLRWTDATAGQAEIRFVFDPAYRRQGYASEAVGMMLDVAFGSFGFHRVFARCAAKNQSSARLLRRLGMRLEAHYREHALFLGEWDEELHFAILDREWQRGSPTRSADLVA